MLAPDRRLLGTFNFRVRLLRSAVVASGASDPRLAAPTSGQPLGDGGFQECNGLDLEMDVQEITEGGRNNGTIRRVGRAKYQNIVLKRGMFYDESGRANRDVWSWLQGIVDGVRPVVRYDGLVEVLAGDGLTVLATWEFDRGLPTKVAGPQLNARTGDVALEELHIAHEGLRLVANQ